MVYLNYSTSAIRHVARNDKHTVCGLPIRIKEALLLHTGEDETVDHVCANCRRLAGSMARQLAKNSGWDALGFR